MTQPRPRVLVARKIFPEGLARLQAVCDVEHNERDEIYSRAVLAEKLAGVAGALVTGSERIDAAALAGAKALKIVSNMMVGYNNFDLAAMSAAGVMGTNTPDVLTDTTADLAFVGCTRFGRHFVKVLHPTGVFKWALPEGSSARNLRSRLSN